MLAGLRSRLVIAFTAMTLLTLGGAFAAVAQAVNRSQEHQLDDALRVEAREEANEAARVGGRQLDIHDGPGPRADDVGSLTKYGAIYGADGTILDATQTFDRGIPPLDSIRHPSDVPFDLWSASEHLRGVLEAVPGHPEALLLLAAPRWDLDRDTAYLHRAMLFVFIIAVLWSAVLTAWAVRLLTRDQHRLIAQAAHELRAPLTTLLGELGHALRRSRDAGAYRQAIEEAVDSTRRLTLLTDDLLAMAKLGRAAVSDPEPVSLASVLDGATRLAALQAQARGVTVVVAPGDAAVVGRARDLERMVRNLVENAVRFSPTGGRVDVRAESAGDTVELVVGDEGPGVPPNERERIFEPFYRCARDRAGESTGAGLGLSIVREIARAHGGSVRLDATPVGARFVVTLPATRYPRLASTSASLVS